jgi:hypothetical protein
MDIFYSFFIISVVIATFFVIFKRLTRATYWTMAIIAILYSVLLVFSFLLDFP